MPEQGLLRTTDFENKEYISIGIKFLFNDRYWISGTVFLLKGTYSFLVRYCDVCQFVIEYDETHQESLEKRDISRWFSSERLLSCPSRHALRVGSLWTLVF
jgi:hypothetical protein